MKLNDSVDLYINNYKSFMKNWNIFCERTNYYIMNLKYNIQSILKEQDIYSKTYKDLLETIQDNILNWNNFTKKYHFNLDILEIDTENNELEKIHNKITFVLINAVVQLKKSTIIQITNEGKKLYDNANITKSEIKQFAPYITTLKKLADYINKLNVKLKNLGAILKRMTNILSEKELVEQVLRENIPPEEWQRIQQHSEIKKGSYTVMFVDDEPSFLEWGSHVLKDYTVITKNSAINLLEDVELLLPDIIILDVNMPGMTGIDFLKILKKSFDIEVSQLPIIMFSSERDEAVVKECIQLGAKYFLSKPASKDELIKLINVFLPNYTEGILK